MSFDSLRLVSWLAPISLLTAIPALAQEGEVVLEEEVTSATPEVVTRLLSVYQSAVEGEDASEIADVLATMSAHNNEEFQEPALEGLEYKASSLDKKAARAMAIELDTVSRKEIGEIVFLREAGVQEAAAHVLANIPGKASTRGLTKAFKDKSIRKDKPTVRGAVIRALGELGYDKIERDVVKELAMFTDKTTTRACVRYLGQIKTRDYTNVRKLIELLDPPEPADVNDPNNPPASYWAVRWEQWSWVRRDVAWSLKEITGQTFRPREGEHASDARKAFKYIKEHKKELRLR